MKRKYYTFKFLKRFALLLWRKASREKCLLHLCYL